MLDILAFLLTLTGFGLFLKNPINLGYLVGALTSLFVLLPLLIYDYLSADFIAYSMEQLSLVSVSVLSTTKLYVVAIGAFWLAGAAFAGAQPLLGQKTITAKKTELASGRVIILLVLTWSVYSAAVLGSGLSIMELFTPSAKYDIEFLGSAYVEGLVIATPTAAACLVVSIRRKIDWLSLLSLASALAIAMGTAQRRNILIVMTAFMICAIFARVARGKALSPEKLNSKLKRYVIIALPMLSLLGPLLWYARNYFTVLNKTGSANIDFTLQVRGFSELFFGSAATAYPTTAMVVEMQRETYMSLGSSFYFLFASPIPRAIWPSKPENPASTLIQYYNLDFSPSTFFATEIVMNFAELGPLVAFFMAYALVRHSQKLMTSSDALRTTAASYPIRNQIMFAFLVGQSLLLFKNGFTLFILNLGIWYAISWIVFSFSTMRAPNV